MVHGQNSIGEEEMNILIKEAFSNDFTSREAGEKLRNTILTSNTKVTLDFKGLQIASASFFDEGLAKLMEHGWNENDFRDKLELKNIFHKDLALFHKILELKGIKLSI
jgi:hypothetical protein